MPSRSIFLAFVLLASLVARAPGQRIRPQTQAPTVTMPGNQRSGTVQNGLTPIPSISVPSTNGGAGLLQQPTFDPYATTPGAANTAPSLLGAPPSTAASGGAAPAWQPPTTVTPGFSPTPGYPSNGAVGPVYPQQPPVLFPNGINIPYGGLPQAQAGQYLRLFQDVRFQYTWLAGDDDPDRMTINDVELGTTINFPNFLFSGAPLHVSPGFTFHFWSGPNAGPPFDLPARVYSTFVDFAWNPMLTPMFGGELNAAVGVFSDFKKVRRDDVRVYGTGLMVLHLTPTVTAKAGVNYLDRVDIKLLPAGGIVWTPNPQTRFDIYFPRPKLAQYLTTIGNTDIWWYLHGEYGGGSWNIENVDTDINDIRAGVGLEWTHMNGVHGFVETAVVFEREIVLDTDPHLTKPLEETIMVRGGLTY